MSILNITSLDVSVLPSVQDEPSFESTVHEEHAPSVKLDVLLDLRDRVVSRGTVCRKDALDMFIIRNEHQSIRNHLNQISPAMYTESLSTINLKETVASLESAVSKTVMSTMSDLSDFISSRAKSAIDYISDIFDDELIANKNALRIMIMVEYNKTISGILSNSKEAKGLDRGFEDLSAKAIDSIAPRWNGLKELINNPKSDMQTLIDGISGPVVTHYPEVLSSVISLLEGLDKAKTPDEIRKLMKSIKVPVVGYGKVDGWMKKQYPSVRYPKIDGGTPFQSVAFTVRDNIKKLNTDQTTRFKSKPKTFLKDSDYVPMMTSQVAAERNLSKSKETTSKYASELNRLGKVAQKLVVSQSYEAEAMPLILEILSLVRGFSALEESLGIIALSRRELINDYMQSMATLTGDVHGLISKNASKFMVSEVKAINDATIKLKASLAEI